jgi:hypothetical protein
MTRLPLAGSPAIDAGSSAALAGMGGVSLYDQRGNPYTRVWDGDGAGGARIDIGAVELQTLPLPRAVYGDYNADGVVDGGDYVLARKTAGASVTPYSDADGSGNAVVGSEDITVWRAHYGETVAAGTGSSASSNDSGAVFEALTPGSASNGDSGSQPPAQPGVVMGLKMQADVAVKRQATFFAGARSDTAGQASSGTQMEPPPEPRAIGPLREDALLAWVESVHQPGAVGASNWSVSSDDPLSNDALDSAINELAGSSLVASNLGAELGSQCAL